MDGDISGTKRANGFSDFCVVHGASAPKGCEGRSQIGPKGPQTRSWGRSGPIIDFKSVIIMIAINTVIFIIQNPIAGGTPGGQHYPPQV